MFKRKTFIILGIAISLILLIFSILSSINMSITTSSNNSEIVFGADFPNAKCNKVFKRDFPFFEFKCTPLSEDTTDQTINETKNIPEGETEEAKDEPKTEPKELANP